MAKCKDCLHYEACLTFSKFINAARDVEQGCEHFKDRTNYAEVVPCKDCKSWEQYNACDGTKPHRCMNHDAIFYKRTKPDDFCSYGERRTDDE